METAYEMTVTMNGQWRTEIEKRYAEALVNYPGITMEQFLGAAIRYYLDHAYGSLEHRKQKALLDARHQLELAELSLGQHRNLARLDEVNIRDWQQTIKELENNE